MKELVTNLTTDPEFSHLSQQLQEVKSESEPERYTNIMQNKFECYRKHWVKVVRSSSGDISSLPGGMNLTIESFVCLFVLSQFPQLSRPLETRGNPRALENYVELIEQLKKDSELEPILAEINANVPAAMLKYVLYNSLDTI